jgi:hypothetical protein
MSKESVMAQLQALSDVYQTSSSVRKRKQLELVAAPNMKDFMVGKEIERERTPSRSSSSECDS